MKSPDGYKLAPLSPTREMLDAARREPMALVLIDSMQGRADLDFETKYRAAISVLPMAEQAPQKAQAQQIAQIAQLAQLAQGYNEFDLASHSQKHRAALANVVLGCDDCSETLRVVSAETIAAHLPIAALKPAEGSCDA